MHYGVIKVTAESLRELSNLPTEDCVASCSASTAQVSSHFCLSLTHRSRTRSIRCHPVGKRLLRILVKASHVQPAAQKRIIRVTHGRRRGSRRTVTLYDIQHRSTTNLGHLPSAREKLLESPPPVQRHPRNCHNTSCQNIIKFYASLTRRDPAHIYSSPKQAVVAV